MASGLVRAAGFCLLIFTGMATGAQAADMTFRAEPVGSGADCRNGCPKVIVAEGVITRSTPGDFLNFIHQNLRDKSFRNVIFISSAGGSVAPAMQLGSLFRKLNSTVIVGQTEHTGEFGNDPRIGVPLKTAGCYSACLFALMGGKTRVVPDASVVGVHRIHTRGQMDVATSDKRMMYMFAETDLVATMRGYAKVMGVSPDLINLAESVGPNDIHKLSPDELRAFRLAKNRF